MTFSDPLKIAFNKHAKLKLGRCVYSGGGECDEYIFSITNHPNKLVKVVYASQSHTNEMIDLFRYLKKTKNKSVVDIHKFGSFIIDDEGKHIDDEGKHYDHVYYYVMSKLKKIPYNQANEIINHMYDFYEYGRLKRRAPTSVKNFVKKVDKLKYQYGDLHEYNIMKDSRGSLKFIDLESFMF